MTIPGGPAPLSQDTALSPEWLTAMHQSHGRAVTVTATSVTERLETVATKVRLRVAYAGAKPQSGAPAAICVKGYFNPATHRRLVGTQPETLFYRDLASTLPVRTPPCVHAAIDPATGHGLLIMDDLVEQGASFLDPLTVYTADQAAATLEQLAALHSTYWNRDDQVVAAMFPPRFESLLDYFSTEALQRQLDDGRAAGLPGEVLDAARVRSALLALAQIDRAEPRCLVHGDLHTGNVYQLATGQPGLIDWQVVQWGSWALDVAYHLAAVLDPVEAARSERGLIDYYLDCLTAHGVEAPARDDAWRAYRAHLPYGFFMWGITRAVDRPIIEHLIRRLGEGVARHQSLDLLGV